MNDDFNNNIFEDNSLENTENVKSSTTANNNFQSDNINTESKPKDNEYNRAQNNSFYTDSQANNNYNQNKYEYNYGNQFTPPNASYQYTNYAQPFGQPVPQQNIHQTTTQNNSYQSFQEQNSPYFLYNGIWYYNSNVASNAPKEKMSASMKVFLTIIFSILGIMLGTLIVVCCLYGSDFLKSISSNAKYDSSYNDYYDNYGNYDYGDYYNYGDGNYNGNYNNKEDENDNYPDYSNPDGPSIELKNGAGKASGTAQSAFKKLSPSVVAITTYSDTAESTSSSYFSDADIVLGEGTGLIISKDGYIITNSHVINHSKRYKVTVTLDNSEEFDAKIVGFDQRTDLAILKIDTTENLMPCEFADSTDLSIGQDVIAIGNPGGKEYSNSITKGIISAVNRQVNQYPVAFIQTDAAINPGNSGGPLANLDGKVIGITNIKVVDTEYEGMGFAIPSTTVKKIADDLIKNGKVTGRAILGITCATFSPSQVNNPSHYTDIKNGVYVSEVNIDSPLYGKLKSGDIITNVDNTKITSLNDLYAVLEKYSPGDDITLKVFQPNKGTKEIKTTLMES